MTQGTLGVILPLALAVAAAGLLVGLSYFAALRRTVQLYGANGNPLWPAALTIGRMVGAAAFLVLAARLGALPLLAGFSGFILARAIALYAVRRAG